MPPSPPQSPEMDNDPSIEQNIDLRRSYTMPTRGSADSNDHVALRHSKSDVIPASSHRLDRFGFILNMDSHGNVFEPTIDDTDSQAADKVLTFAEVTRNERREKKWNTMMASWPLFRKRRNKLVKKRLRKGIPHSQRGTVWKLLGRVPEKIKANPGVYDKLVIQSYTTDPKNVQETIERDLHRTYPRHSMFFETGDENDSDDVLDEDDVTGLCGTSEISNMIRELDFKQAPPLEEGPPTLPATLEAQGGQASLRRVLKAYSLYDSDIGYCQGMNFIAGMFLTFMSEEESFWLLVAIMYDEPCKMRGLFGEGMQETHKVLYVAEKLIHQFLPRLSKHLDREHIHITMFATQWLLTQYTSSFKFDLVTRVWDCFLGEGWKITYRVMLAILQQWQSALLKMSFEEILAFFRELPDRVDGSMVDLAIKIPLRRKHIDKYEKEYQAQQRQQQGQS